MTVERTPAQTRRATWIALFLLFLLAGAIMFGYFNERFVFGHAWTSMKAAPWVLMILTIVVICLMQFDRGFTERLARKYPTDWLRSWVVIPVFALMLVGLACVGALGWFMAAAAWSGSAVLHVDATAIAVGAHRRAKGCDQSATLRILAVDKKTCLDGLYPPAAMQNGESLDVGIIASPAGFLIVSISGTAPAAEPAGAPGMK